MSVGRQVHRESMQRATTYTYFKRISDVSLPKCTASQAYNHNSYLTNKNFTTFNISFSQWWKILGHVTKAG